MPLTVLKSVPASSPADLLRLFNQSQLEWSRGVGEETELDFGRWLSNPALKSCEEANCLLDAFLLPGVPVADVIRQIEDTRCLYCTVNPSMGLDRSPELIAALVDQGWILQTTDIFYRNQAVAPKAGLVGDRTVIPARASFRHYRQLMDERGIEPEAALLHLDDSHFDALLALQKAKPVGCVGVLTSGEVGTIREWYVSPEHRNRGIGQLLLDRALEICSRSVLRHVLIGLPQAAENARRLCTISGFQMIGKTSILRRYPPG
jgi:GNAT superfamily N-acetyltransferase